MTKDKVGSTEMFQDVYVERVQCLRVSLWDTVWRLYAEFHIIDAKVFWWSSDCLVSATILNTEVSNYKSFGSAKKAGIFGRH